MEEDDLSQGDVTYGTGSGMRLMKVMKILPNKNGGPLLKRPTRTNTKIFA